MMFEKQDRELRLKDLIFCVLRRWRSIFALALVGAVALGGLKYYTLEKNQPAPVDRTAYLEALEEYKAQQADKEQELQWLQAQVDAQRTYLQQSVLMNLDPTNVYRAELELTIADGDNYQLLNQYRAALQSDDFVETAAASFSIEGKYLRELMKITLEDRGTETLPAWYLKVVLYHGTPESAEQLLMLTKQYVSELSSQLEPHELQLWEQAPVLRVDTNELAGRQWTEEERLTYYEKGLASAKKNLKNMSAPKDPFIPGADTIRGGIKFAIIGFGLGGILGCGLGVLVILFGDKLYSASDLKGRYDIKLLGVVAGNGKRSLIDKCLDRLEGRQTRDTLQNDALIRAIVRKQAGDAQVLLLGPEALAQDLSKRLELPGLMTGEGDLKMLESCDSVLLVAVCGKDRYRQLGKTMELAADLGKDIVGCIVAEF